MLTVLNVYANTAIMPKGKGTKEEPFLIERWENLYWMSVPNTINGISYQQKMEKYYVQTADINFPKDISKWDNGKGWLPIGYLISIKSDCEQISFKGSYNGQNFKIGGLFISREDNVGLFGRVLRAELKNIHLENVDITGRSYVGGLAGYVSYSRFVESNFKKIIENCSSTGKIVGYKFIGGLFGSCYEADIYKCTTKIYVSGNSEIGGVAGIIDGNMYNSGSRGIIIAQKSNAGGLAGKMEGNIAHCFSEAEITSPEFAGGLVGKMESFFEIDDSYSQSIIKSDKMGGGLLSPLHEGLFAIRNTYYKASLYKEKGIIVKTEGAIDDKDFDKWLKNGMKPLSNLKKNNKGEYLISNVSDFRTFRQMKHHPNNKYVLMNDLDLSNDKDFCVSFFSGTFDGNDKTLFNLNINLANQDYIALFQKTKDSVIKNLNMKNLNVSGHDYTAGLCAVSENTIIMNCSMVGSIKGVRFTSGLVSNISHNSVAKNCFVNGTVYGKESAGGVVGCGYGVILNCINESEVFSDNEAAGIVYSLENYENDLPVMVNCFNKGSIKGVVTAGLAIEIVGKISGSYNMGNVTGIESASGLVNYCIGLKNYITIENCYNSGQVSSQQKAAGLLVEGGFVIKNCYNSGLIIGRSYVAGLISIGGGYIIDSYNEGNIQAESIYGGIISSIKEHESDFEIYDYEIFEDKGNSRTILINSYYNYEKVKINGKSKITFGALDNELYEKWFSEAKNLYIMDYLLNDEHGNYQIWDVEDFIKLLAFGYYFNNTFILMNDIDLKDESDFYIPVFNSKFNGNGKTFRNLNVNLPDLNNIGLFGHGYTHEIYDLTLENATVAGRDFIGLLSGFNSHCSYRNITAQGTVISNGTAGGLIGQIERGNILQSEFSGNIQAKKWAGGLIGTATNSVIEICHVNASIVNQFIPKQENYYHEELITIKTYATGGLIGYLYTSKLINSFAIVNMNSPLCGGLSGTFSKSFISNSYSISKLSGKSTIQGLIADKQVFPEDFYERFEGDPLPEEFSDKIVNSYLNKDVLSLSKIKHGILLSTSELKNQNLLQKAGWDFRNVWNIDPQVNEGYPVFKHRSE